MKGKERKGNDELGDGDRRGFYYRMEEHRLDSHIYIHRRWVFQRAGLDGFQHSTTGVCVRVCVCVCVAEK
jgi:hypothetical protein